MPAKWLFEHLPLSVGMAVLLGFSTPPGFPRTTRLAMLAALDAAPLAISLTMGVLSGCSAYDRRDICFGWRIDVAPAAIALTPLWPPALAAGMLIHSMRRSMKRKPDGRASP